MLDRLWTRGAVVAACFLAAYGLRHGTLDMPESYWHALLAALASFALIESLLPSPRRSGPFLRWLGQLGRLALMALLLLAVGYVLKTSETFSRLWSVYWLALSWIALGLIEELKAGRKNWQKRLILVGEKAATQRQQANLTPRRDQEIITLTLPQALPWLKEQAEPLQDDEILLVGPLPDEMERAALILALHGNQVALRYCPDGLGGGHLAVPLLPSLGPIADAVKRMEDIVLGSLALALCTPLLLALTLLVKLDGPGPVFFRQRRLGLGGRAFIIYKFRTMAPNAATEAQATQASANDSRVTRIGRHLRHWGLDELPQLFNVLNGDMSLVGPRPHAFPHDLLWGTQLSNYTQRFRVRPGLSGLAQIHGRRGYAETLDDIKARLALDLEYIDSWSLGLDLRILLGTLPALVRDARKNSATGQLTRDEL